MLAALLVPLSKEGELLFVLIPSVTSPCSCHLPSEAGRSLVFVSLTPSAMLVALLVPLSKEGQLFVTEWQFISRLRKWLSIMYSAARCRVMLPLYRAVSSAKRVRSLSGVLGMSSIMWGVSHRSFTPAASYVASMRSASSMLSTPSSTPGSIWEWWSVYPARMPLWAIVLFLLNGHILKVKG